MGKCAIILFLSSCIGLSLAYLDVNDEELKSLNGTCLIYNSLLIISRKTNDVVNGGDIVRMRGSLDSKYYQRWYADAGIGWFVLRNMNNGLRYLDIEGGCKNADQGTKLITSKKDQPTESNKFIFNSDGTIQTLCDEDLYLKADGEYLVLDFVNGFSNQDIRFLMRSW